MYPANINSNANPFSFDVQFDQHRHLFTNDNNPTSKFDDLPSSSFFHLPSPCMQYEDAVNELTWQQLHDLFIQQQPSNATDDQTESNMADHKSVDDNEQNRQGCTTNQQTGARKKSSKKDRHSKITTAHGPRDRRMRLSLPVARKFFGLQDILGYDKASKTIEWLLIQSSSAIKQIMRGLQQPLVRHTCSAGGANSISSTSECEVISGIEESANDEIPQKSISMKLKIPSSFNQGKKAKLARRTAFHDQDARESRKIARERARKRTMEKRKLGESMMIGEEINLESWVQFERNEESGSQSSTTKNVSRLPLYEGLPEVDELSSLVMSGNWNLSSLVSNYEDVANVSQEQDFGGFLWQ